MNCSQLSLHSLSYHPTTINNNNSITPEYSSLSYIRRIKKTFTKNFCCHQTRLSSSCLKCFRYFIPTKHKCECQNISFNFQIDDKY